MKSLKFFLLLLFNFFLAGSLQFCLGMEDRGQKKEICFSSLRFRAAFALAKSINKGIMPRSVLQKMPLDVKNFVVLLIKMRFNLFDALCSTISQPTLYSSSDARDLLRAGANPNGVDANNKTLLMLAIDQCSVERAQLLLEQGADVDQKNKWGLTPIFYAIGKNYCPGMVLFFLNHHADIHQIKSNNRENNLTLLIDAIDKKNHFLVIQKLIELGADVKKPDYKWTALSYGAKRKSPAVVNLLLEHGADVHGINPLNKGNALHLAAIYDSPLVAARLLESGISIDSIDMVHDTPLMEAARHGSYQAASLLLKRGANRFLRNLDRKNALDLARQKEDFCMMKLLTKE